MNDSTTSSGAAKERPAELPLWEAAIAWCDPALVQELLSSHAAYRAASNRPPAASPFPTHEDRVRARFIAMGMGGPELDLSHRRNAAVTKIDIDFRRRVAAQQMVLTGLRVKPDLDHTRTTLPHGWANHLTFDWEHGTVSVYGAVYVDVTGQAVVFQPYRSDTAHGGERAEQANPRSYRPAGRASYKPMIEAAFSAYLSEVGKSREALAAAKTNQSHLAGALETRLKKRYPDKAAVAGGLPGRETIRKHVRDILASAPVEKGGR